jgi:acyl carrier protein|tara:strand:+ start:28075 stop:28311 length:237 start_codon:yes stop_codon:yes gene_type:complete
MSTFKKLQDIMAAALELPVEAIRENSTMDDIEEWDSLGHVHIMVALEQAFDLYMDVEDFAELENVPAILQYLASENAV